MRYISSSRRSLLPTFLRLTKAACHPAVQKCVARPHKRRQKMSNERHRRRRYPKAQHPYSTPLNNHIHVCCLIWNTMNALCFSVAALPQLPRWPPLASHCLWLSGKSSAGTKKGPRYKRTRSSRKTWVPASRSVMFVTCGTRNTPCTDMRHELFGFQRHT